MKKHKVIMGEWVSVYCNTTMIITTDKDIENMTADDIARLLDNDEYTTYEPVKEDYDWTTVEHEDWDRHTDDCQGYTYLHEIKGDE